MRRRSNLCLQLLTHNLRRTVSGHRMVWQLREQGAFGWRNGPLTRVDVWQHSCFDPTSTFAHDSVPILQRIQQSRHCFIAWFRRLLCALHMLNEASLQLLDDLPLHVVVLLQLTDLLLQSRNL